MACRDGTPYPTMWRRTRALLLAEEVNALTKTVGTAPIVLSGYRTFAWHIQHDKGRARCPHLEGRALDLAPPPGLTMDEWWDVVYAQSRNGLSRIRGLGRYDMFLHIDVRPTRRLIWWRGQRPDGY
jgi:hypothetical protein